MDVLRRFYCDVRPIGFWGPVEAELPPEERKSIRKRAGTTPATLDVQGSWIYAGGYFSKVVGGPAAT